MKKITILVFFSVVLFACNKASNDRKVLEEGICYVGKIVATNCRGNAIVQILRPQVDFLKASVYKVNTQDLLENVVSTDVPVTVEYAVGDTFYFKVKDFSIIGVTTQECVWPKYAGEIVGVSKQSCDSITSK